jgi:hypothetical protein
MSKTSGLEHFHLFYGKMYLNRRRLFRRARWEMSWKNSVYSSREAIESTWQNALRTAEINGDVSVTPADQLKPDDLHEAWGQPRDPLVGRSQMRVYACKKQGCKEEVGGFRPRFDWDAGTYR